MTTARVAFLGGNGHSAARLAPARRVLAELPRSERFELSSVAYPGFEGRPCSASWDEFLESTGAQLTGATHVHATGIGALVALALRARPGSHAPLVIQGGVLWGLEHRTFPKLMRGPMPHLLRLAFRLGPLQRRFARKYFQRAPSAEDLRAFFAGYRECRAFPQFFRWFRAPLLQQLERDFAADPTRLDGVTFWWGERDAVVGLDELRATERALAREFPCRRFPAWGHYPMLDDPAGWVSALKEELAS